MKKLQDILQSCGLTQKEAGLYCAALSLGITSVTQLARKAALKRPTTYLIIESLLGKGLLVAIPRGKKMHYKPETPQYFANTIREQQAQIDEILPELERLYQNSSGQPKIRFYEGRDKLIKLYEEIFRSKEIWAILSVDGFLKVFKQEDEKHFFRILIRRGGIIYDLLENTEAAHAFARAPYRSAVGKVKLLSKNIKIATDILVFDGNVAMISFESVVAAVIENRDIATTIKMMLRFIWNSLPPVILES